MFRLKPDQLVVRKKTIVDLPTLVAAALTKKN